MHNITDQGYTGTRIWSISKHVTPPVLIILSLLIVRLNYGVLLFHTLAELFSVVVGVLMLVVAWNTRCFTKNNFLVFLGIGYFWIAVLDTFHTFTVKGIPFFEITGAEITLHFWIYTRFLEATLLLLSIFFLKRKLYDSIFFFVGGIIAAIIVWASFSLKEPVMLTPDGLTPFKVAIEYVIITMLTLSGLIFVIKRKQLPLKVLISLLGSILMTILAELSFTLYTSFSGAGFFFGHIFKFISFWMIYQAIIQTTLKEPFSLLATASSTYDAIPHPAIVVDAKGIVSQVNQAAIDFSGGSVDQLIHKHVHDIFHPADTLTENCRLCQAIEEGKYVTNIPVNIKQQEKWYLASLSPVNTETIKSGMVQTLTDITERKRNEDELQMHHNHLEDLVADRTAALVRSNTELEEFAYIASHDLQEPLRMVNSYMTLLEKRYSDKLDDDAAEFIGFAVDGAVRMQTLISDLLKYSRVDSKGKEFGSVDCNSILKAALENLTVAIDESGAEVTSSELPTVIGDSTQLIQLFQNLIGNAIKFRGDKTPQIGVEVRQCDTEWLFSVKDNGIGVKAEYYDKIFQVFQRLHSRDQYQGTGIGLAVCKKIVTRHGGEISVDSEPGAGTTFSFSIKGETNGEVL